MQALVVYESFFGNTERVANAVGVAIGAAAVGEPGPWPFAR